MSELGSKIENVIVIMFENRSFDHLFGAFPGVNGLFEADGTLKPQIYNLDRPTEPHGPSNQKHFPYPITPEVTLEHDLNHDFGDGMMSELFGPRTQGWVAGVPLAAPVTDPEVNAGFYSTIAWNADGSGSTINGDQAMSYYEQGSLQVLHGLASEFVLCDNWFCDTPGDTLLNRYFMHTAQCDNSISDDSPPAAGTAATSIFKLLEPDRSWKMYAPESVQNGEHMLGQFDSRFIGDVQSSPNTHRPISEFVSDLAGGSLPFYSFLMCWVCNASPSEDTSMHPTADIRAGENLLAAVYGALRSSSYWDKSLLVVTFDENGGFYDHVPPPVVVAPMKLPPAMRYDIHTKITYKFDFTLLGPRLPALLISPWLGKGIASGQYQNTSILRFLEDLAGTSSLTDRDKNAPSLAGIFDEFGVSEPRTDCPESMPAYAGFPYSDGDLTKPVPLPPGAQPAPYLVKTMERVYGE